MRTAHRLSWTGWGGRSRVGSLLAYPPPIIKKRKTNTAISTNTKIINNKNTAAQIHARALLLKQKIKNLLVFVHQK